ncbi:MAG: hypothetical protein B6D65_02635 [candidate division Zixibacteria bacterium 4484_93]|nr:MAG: hypothetical protein B6D65_02635 [candidate division Zixibacteria bacterium 4484_93]
MKNIYYPYKAELTKIKDETSNIKTFFLKLSQPLTFKGGQFMQLSAPGIGEAPFTPSSEPGEVDEMTITILKTGRITDYLHEKVKPGDILGLRGPFGHGYPTHLFDGKTVLVIGGGVGLAPLRACLYALFGECYDRVNRISIKYGARSPYDLVFRDEYEEWAKKEKVDMSISIDRPHPEWEKGAFKFDGVSQTVGLVTVLLDNLDVDIENTYAVSCGPEIMLKFVTYKLLDLGFKPEQIYLSMNRRMSCGVGKCHRCNIGPYYLCKDGPDMCYADIMNYDPFGSL